MINANRNLLRPSDFGSVNVSPFSHRKDRREKAATALATAILEANVPPAANGKTQSRPATCHTPIAQLPAII